MISPKLYNAVFGRSLGDGKPVGFSLQWRHNDHDDVSNHQPHDCLLNLLFRRMSKKTSKLRVTGLCAGNLPGPGNLPHKGPVTRKMFPFDDVIVSCLVSHCAIRTGPWFNIKTSSYQFRKSYCGDKTVVGSSYLHNGISYTGTMSSLYWIGAQVSCKVSISSDLKSALAFLHKTEHQCLLRYLKHPGKHEPTKGALQPR